MTKNYLLMAMCSDDGDGITWSCDLALLRVDEPFLALLRRRVALLRDVYARDAAVHEVSFWAASQVAFYEQAAIDLMGLSVEDEALLDGDSFVFLDRILGSLPASGDLHQKSVELTQMTVRLNGSVLADEPPSITVLWSAVPEHAETSVLTAHVPIELFEI